MRLLVTTDIQPMFIEVLLEVRWPPAWKLSTDTEILGQLGRCDCTVYTVRLVLDSKHNEPCPTFREATYIIFSSTTLVPSHFAAQRLHTCLSSSSTIRDRDNGDFFKSTISM